ncbi:MAG: hypothetical protein C0506_06370 [Anaerolinea sp.]|nr:hypothetical protein [Anaerolinea sp.]
MNCPSCRGHMVEAVFDVAELFNGEPVVFRGVRGLRCSQCGETEISADVALEIEDLLLEGPPAGEERARVYVLHSAA